jgi:AcrR family transcriptional regulator
VVTRSNNRKGGKALVGRARDGERTRQAIRDSARELFAARGYAGTSLRHIAMAVGVEVGSLYGHIASKEELLYDLIRSASDQLLEQLKNVVDTDDPPLERLRAAVEEMTRHHAEHREQSLIGSVELRELLPHHHRRVLKQREQVESLFKDLVTDCVKIGYFSDDANITVTAYFLIGVSTSVAGWYNPDGPLTPDDIAMMASEFALPDRRPARGRATLRRVRG